MNPISSGGGKFLGARVKRVEDPRFLLGKSTFVDDIQLPGTLHVAFHRSIHAHARVCAIDTSLAAAVPGVRKVVTAQELRGVISPLRVDWDPSSGAPPSKASNWFVLADQTVRFVGEAIAAVVADNRYIAEDASELIQVDYEPLEVVTDVESGLAPGAPLLHPDWGDNVALSFEREIGDVAQAFAKASLVVGQRFRTARHVALPLETRGVLASLDVGSAELTVWSSSQIPQTLKRYLAHLLAFPENRLRVVAPDVGGGFGQKAHVFPEEIVIAYLALQFGRPVKWIEDRRENLSAALHAKEQIVDAELAVSDDGTIAALKARFVSDIGAYTEYPWSPGIEPVLAGGVMPGAYRVPAYRYECQAVCTNKATLGVYRGVGAPIATFVIEGLLDIAARKLALDPVEIRLRNMIEASDHPYQNVVGITIESGSHQEALRKAIEMADYAGFRRAQETDWGKSRFTGLGLASFVELTAPSSRAYLSLGAARTAGWETARVQIDAAGKITVSAGTHSHGQGHATTFAQVAADELGVELEDVRVEYGDTARAPFGWGTNASRSAVVGGGATAKACGILREKLLRIASRRLEIPMDDLELRDRQVRRRRDGQVLGDLADLAYAAIIPPDGDFHGEEPGLDVTAVYEPPFLTHNNATHLAIVEVDVLTGLVKILRYIVVEDCGTMINPTIVEGQIQGGVAQGIGGALYEQIVYDDGGQLLTGTLIDYLVPTAIDVPKVEIAHFESPSPHTFKGIKGMGEGGAIGPAAAIANAVRDALSPLAVQIAEIPLTPERILRQIETARRINSKSVASVSRSA